MTLKTHNRRPVRVEDIRAYEINNVYLGVPLILLMENAGRSVADTIESRLGTVQGKTIHILAGKGGNGGDGLVAARHLAGRGAKVTVHLASHPNEIKHPDTRLNLEAALRSNKIRVLWPGKNGWLHTENADAIVDAMLGTGVKGPLRGYIREMADTFNKSEGLRIAVDTPTGLDPDTGIAVEGAVRADITVTMGWLKKGLLEPGARLYTGEIIVADIGIHPDAETYAGPGDVVARLPPRPRDAHKGVGGRVLIIAGGHDYVGAAVLSAMAASYSGVDLVFLASAIDTARHCAFTCSSVVPIPYKKSVLSGNDVETILRIAEKAHSVLIGPGIGRSEETLEAAAKIIEHLAGQGKPVVVDADGLHAITMYGPVKLSGNVVLTPHRGEARKLAGREDTPQELAKHIARNLGATVVVKAPEDVVCSPDGTCRLNRTGVPAMSVGGTGDVLAGLLAGFLARRASKNLEPDPLNTAAAALFVVGKAGEKAWEDYGEQMTARDVVERIRWVIEWSRTVAH